MSFLILLAAAALSAPADAASQDPVQGRALVECAVTPAGRLKDCRVISESPTGANVGAFAVKLAGGFQIDPKDRRIRAGKIRLPMRFKLPGTP
jgi:TonB family protein